MKKLFPSSFRPHDDSWARRKKLVHERQTQNLYTGRAVPFQLVTRSFVGVAELFLLPRRLSTPPIYV
jgi:hypothetical protein